MLSSLEAERVLAEMSPREREVTGLLANGLSNAAIAERLGLSERTVQGRGRTVRFDEAFEAKIAELASGAPPEGVQAWTLRLLAEKAVEAGGGRFGVADDDSPDSQKEEPDAHAGRVGRIEDASEDLKGFSARATRGAAALPPEHPAVPPPRRGGSPPHRA